MRAVHMLAPIALAAATALAGTDARAKEAGAGASVSTEGASADGEANKPRPGAKQWFSKHTPRKHMFEVGAFGGVWLPSRRLELHDRNLPFQRYERVSGEIGLRLGYYPMRHFGFEGELAMMPTRVETEQRTFVSTARAHGVLQLGLYRLVPFFLIGGGVLSVRSEGNAIGNDSDQAMHFGGGLKLFLDRNIQLRLDVRDVLSPKEGITVNDPADTVEVLLGFSLALGPRKPKKKGPPDADGDGKIDSEDKCPFQASTAEDGCPRFDDDHDGFDNGVDKCPKVAGAAPDGCPLPDSDDDGYLDVDDACPREEGVDPDGCPIRDEDGDGLLAPADKCPSEPETRNGFEDDDGCPDDIPDAVKEFTGVIEGIEFDTGKATIRKTSTDKLDRAAKLLQDYPSLRLEISGHTDDRGKRDKNLTLSLSRADSVKQYLVDAGVDAGRLQTRGAGPDEPIEDNKTNAGRQKNRRIEFKVLLPEAAAAPEPAPEPARDDAEAPASDASDEP